MGFILQWVEPMREAGADQYTFHIEATEIPEELCRQIHESGMKVGIAVKPNTPITKIEEYIEAADMILIMTVEPGFGGQKFMSNMMPKVRHLRQRFPNLNIEVDGGVGPATIQECAQVKIMTCLGDKKMVLIMVHTTFFFLSLHQAGANMIVSGTAVVRSDDPSQVINELKTAVDKAIISGC